LFEAEVSNIVLLDLMMPRLNGFEFMEQIKPVLARRSYLPILVLTADATPATKHKALEAGSKNFLTKPFNQTQLTFV
jgi:CheY-like chemotaxis protein